MVLFKIFENILSEKLSSYFETILSKFQCGFRKEFSTLYCLFCLPKKWREDFVKDKAFEAVEGFRLFKPCFVNCKIVLPWYFLTFIKIVGQLLDKQRTKVKSSDIFCETIRHSVPKGLQV